MTEKLKKILIVRGVLEVLTGLHIGGLKETVKIGGVDNPIIRDGNGNIFLPGSSLKGKLRYLLELSGKEDKILTKLFGPKSKSEETNKEGKKSDEKKPGLLIVRDAYPTEPIIPEVKPENTIKQDGQAMPREQERVPKGAKFNVEFVLGIPEGDDENIYLGILKEGLRLLELNYLGGSGTRGYGKVRFERNLKKYKVEPGTDLKEQPDGELILE